MNSWFTHTHTWMTPFGRIRMILLFLERWLWQNCSVLHVICANTISYNQSRSHRSFGLLFVEHRFCFKYIERVVEIISLSATLPLPPQVFFAHTSNRNGIFSAGLQAFCFFISWKKTSCWSPSQMDVLKTNDARNQGAGRWTTTSMVEREKCAWNKLYFSKMKSCNTFLLDRLFGITIFYFAHIFCSIQCGAILVKPTWCW